MTNSINKAIATAKKVAKQSVKLTAIALPALTILQNGLEAHQLNPGDVAGALSDFIQRYTGVTKDGTFSTSEAMLGTGRLLIAGAASYIIKEIT